MSRSFTVVGGGVGGLSSAYHLARNGVSDFRVFEADHQVGGLARSFQWHGVACDLAPHRLFTQDPERLREMLALVDCRCLVRNSRIRIADRWIRDPVNVFELMLAMLPFQTVRIVSTYLAAQMRPHRPVSNFSEFVRGRFGVGLDDAFFRPYAEKLFGIPATEISASWGEAKVRVSGFREMIRKNTKLYFNRFHYPRVGGYGAFVEALYRPVADHVQTGMRLVRVEGGQGGGGYRCRFECADGEILEQESDALISTVPMPVLMRALGRPIDLSYRSANLVYLNIRRPRAMPYHWVYFVERRHKVNRMAEFKNFGSAHEAPDNTVLCAEVTDQEGFSVEAVIEELAGVGFFTPEEVEDTQVIHIPNAYPVYSLDYEEKVARAVSFLATHPNLHFVGRQAAFAHQDVDEIYGAAKDLVVRAVDGGDSGG